MQLHDKKHFKIDIFIFCLHHFNLSVIYLLQNGNSEMMTCARNKNAMHYEPSPHFP
jgi:hypothetical protein